METRGASREVPTRAALSSRKGKGREEEGILAKLRAATTRTLIEPRLYARRRSYKSGNGAAHGAHETLGIKRVSLTAYRIKEIKNMPRRRRPSSGQTGQRRASIAFVLLPFLLPSLTPSRLFFTRTRHERETKGAPTTEFDIARSFSILRNKYAKKDVKRITSLLDH